jgi:hypothetical protein
LDLRTIGFGDPHTALQEWRTKGDSHKGYRTYRRVIRIASSKVAGQNRRTVGSAGIKETDTEAIDRQFDCRSVGTETGDVSNEPSRRHSRRYLERNE